MWNQTSFPPKYQSIQAYPDTFLLSILSYKFMGGEIELTYAEKSVLYTWLAIQL
jgi:hypothetical protein